MKSTFEDVFEEKKSGGKRFTIHYKSGGHSIAGS